MVELENQVVDMVTQVFSRRLYPEIEQNVKSVLYYDDKGIHLPAYCGLKYANLTINNMDGRVAVCGNLDYDYNFIIGRLITGELYQERRDFNFKNSKKLLYV